MASHKQEKVTVVEEKKEGNHLIDCRLVYRLLLENSFGKRTSKDKKLALNRSENIF